jgi:hypothetical protein
LSDGLMIVLVEMLNAGAAPLEVLLPPLLPPPPHAAKTSAPAAAAAASLAELRTFHIRLDRLPWVISGRRVAASLGKRSLRPDGQLYRATERYGWIRDIKNAGKGCRQFVTRQLSLRKRANSGLIERRGR